MRKKQYTQGVTFFITPDMLQALRNISDNRQISLSELLRNIIELFLKTENV
jgi:hypothetical protein